ncbi:MAG: phosphatidylserine decarboxylase family protein [Deltaproteobacteria bacterium]|nr:phosphatidylserine decarboxylase family protein [Deltaproteobacteria bacterium]TLN05001.1 MAG: phosphatidylserine decarboxylase family protein [bacterium]
MRNQNTPIAVEGYPFALGAAFVTLVFAILSWKILALFAMCVTFFIVYFFRNPHRSTPEGENVVVSPADGVVIYLGNAFEKHLGEEMLKISIFMSVFNVHINRVPLSGRVLDTFYQRGKFLDVRDEKATFENEQSGMILETEQGRKIVVVQVAGLIARRIISYPEKGDLLCCGSRYGLIRFGSRLDVFLPKDFDLRVAHGDKTVAGETILGYLP